MVILSFLGLKIGILGNFWHKTGNFDSNLHKNENFGVFFLSKNKNFGNFGSNVAISSHFLFKNGNFSVCFRILRIFLKF